MKKWLLALISIVALSTQVYAGLFGFLGDVASSAVGSSLVSNGNGKQNIVQSKQNIVQNQKNQKIQQALQSMGYYNGAINGNLNTFDSRLAIETLQHKLGYDTKKQSYIAKLIGIDNNQFHKGILDKYTKEDLVYLFELVKEFDNTKLMQFASNGKTSKQTLNNYVERKEKLIKATSDLEKSLSKNNFVNYYISKVMNKSINKEHKRYSKLVTYNDIYLDKIIWEDRPFSRLYNYKEAQKYCKKLTLHNLKWRTPTLNELRSIYKNNIIFRNIPSTRQEFKEKYFYWSSKSETISAETGKKYYTGENDSEKNSVRCVSDY